MVCFRFGRHRLPNSIETHSPEKALNTVKFPMWKAYHKIMKQYRKIPLAQERHLIAEAQKGSEKCVEEIVLRHIGFVAFRLRRKVFPEYLKRFGEDLLSDSLAILYQKVQTYNLEYRDKRGRAKPVKFVSYIWKRIDGHIIDSLKKELAKDKTAKLDEEFL
jgi:DNA-directed RNA polymerase specialized sigma subunit